MTRMIQEIEPVAAIEPDLKLLWEILHWRRPGGSKTEKRFVKKFLDSIGCNSDGYGNRWLKIGDSPVLYSSHTDTVHITGGRQKLIHGDGIIRLAPNETESNCLGADCSAGVWIMLELIRARKPGLYIFHRDEESGGIGSGWIANNAPEMLAGIDIAIALDRKGKNSVITHQASERCASDAFARSLSEQLTSYSADDTGLFTDTANYIRLIPECTNLSVGYESAHSPSETLDYYHASALLLELLALDYSRLIVARDPAEIDDAEYWSAYGSWRDERASGSWRKSGGFSRGGAAYDCRNVLEFCEAYPDAVADILEQYGIGLDDLYQSAPWLN
jgi:hypothetical protein